MSTEGHGSTMTRTAMIEGVTAARAAFWIVGSGSTGSAGGNGSNADG
jgi:hypothetical protein